MCFSSLEIGCIHFLSDDHLSFTVCSTAHFTIGSILPKLWQVVIDCFKCSVFIYSKNDSLAFQTVSKPSVSNMLLKIKAFVNVKASLNSKGA